MVVEFARLVKARLVVQREPRQEQGRARGRGAVLGVAQMLALLMSMEIARERRFVERGGEETTRA